MGSVYINMIVSEGQDYVITARFNPNWRWGGLGHEVFSWFHGWEVGPHATGSGKFRKDYVLRKSMDEFPDPWNVATLKPSVVGGGAHDFDFG